MTRVSGREILREGVAAVFPHLNSQCCGTSVSRDWLDRRCVRIDEATARKLHPALFEYLDYEPEKESA